MRKTLEPFNSYSFRVNGNLFLNNNNYNIYKIASKSQPVSKFSVSSAVYVILEILEPSLEIKVPQNLLRDVNLNENFRLTVDYNKPLDEVFFSVTILYQSEIIHSERQSSNVVSFRLANHLQNIQSDDRMVQIKISVYDPDYFVPFVSSIRVRINLPPQNGDLIISPNIGISINTIF
jgi:REJ domain